MQKKIHEKKAEIIQPVKITTKTVTIYIMFYNSNQTNE